MRIHFHITYYVRAPQNILINIQYTIIQYAPNIKLIILLLKKSLNRDNKTIKTVQSLFYIIECYRRYDYNIIYYIVL